MVESWEKYHWIFLGSSFAMYLLSQYLPNTDPHDWARDEAEERVRRRAAGQEVVYGVNYAALRFMKDKGALTEEAAAELEAGAIPRPYMPQVHRRG